VKIQAAVAVFRDLVLLGTGVFGILHQELTGHVNIELLGMYGLICSVPGINGLIQLLRGNVKLTVTTGSSSESQEQPASSSSS
jgi:hypothetical protein